MIVYCDSFKTNLVEFCGQLLSIIGACDRIRDIAIAHNSKSEFLLEMKAQLVLCQGQTRREVKITRNYHHPDWFRRIKKPETA